MRKDHEWTSKPGYKIFVANAGEVRFDFPQEWVFIPGESALEFHDRQPPDDDCILQLTIFPAPPGFDATSAPLPDFLVQITKDGPQGDTVYGEVHYEKRNDCEVAWREGRRVEDGRDAVTRSCIARGGVSLPLFTMDFWLDDFDRFSPVWDEVLRSLRIGDYVKDPRTGRVTRLDARHN
jgi:hypothetical protein